METVTGDSEFAFWEGVIWRVDGMEGRLRPEEQQAQMHSVQTQGAWKRSLMEACKHLEYVEGRARESHGRMKETESRAVLPPLPYHAEAPRCTQGSEGGTKHCTPRSVGGGAHMVGRTTSP